MQLPKILSPTSTSNTAPTDKKVSAPQNDSVKSQTRPNASVKAKPVDDTDKASETDSVSTATTATRSKFKLNVGAAEFTPSGVNT
jgi:hypothetical protein